MSRDIAAALRSAPSQAPEGVNRVLEHQLREARGRGGDLDLDSLLKTVSAYYDRLDAERRGVVRSMQLMSDEALAPLQLRKLAFDLLSRRRHRLHARLVSQTRMTMLTVWRPSVHQSILMGYFSRGLANSSSSATTRQ